MIKQFLKQLLLSPVAKPLSYYYSGLGTCLMYHRIIDQQHDSQGYHGSFNMTVAESAFAEQMAYLAKHHHCISLDQAISLLAQGTLPRSSVVVTFDDGYVDNYTLALPILKRYNIPATVFVTTGFIDGTLSPWWYEILAMLERCDQINFQWQSVNYHWLLPAQKQLAATQLDLLFKPLDLASQAKLLHVLQQATGINSDFSTDFMTWQQVIAMDQEPLITIGAHTVNHPGLCHCNEQQCQWEMSESKQRLQKQLGHDVKHMAYPFGGIEHVQQREFKIAQAVGYDSAVTTRMGHWLARHKNQLHALPRMDIHYVDDLQKFKWKLKGFEAMRENNYKRVVSE